MSRPLEPFSATVLGLPRIGPNRELERAAEAYWAGRVDAAALHRTAAELRTAQLRAAHDAGTDSVPVGTFSYYDHVLDTAVLLGALPERVRGIDDELDRCCAAARGHQSGFGGTTVGEPGLRARKPRHRGGAGVAARSRRRRGSRAAILRVTASR